MAGRPVRQPYAGVDFIPQSGIYEFGYVCLLYAYNLCQRMPVLKSYT
jgi:hypothetical protein